MSDLTLNIEAAAERTALFNLASVGCSALVDGGISDLATLEKFDLTQAAAVVETSAWRFAAFARLLRAAHDGTGAMDAAMVDELREYRERCRAVLDDDLRSLERLRTTRNPDDCIVGLSIDEGIRHEEEWVEKDRQELAVVNALLERLAQTGVIA